MVSLYLACRLSGLAVNSRNLRIARLALDGQPHIYVLNQRLMLWADATWGSIGMFNGIMGALYGSSDESDSSSEEEEDEDEEDDEAEVELGLEEAGPEHEEVEGEGEEEGGGGQGPQAAAPSGVPPQPLPSVAVGHSHAERSKQVLIQAPLEWSLAEPSRELPGLDPSGLSLHAMTCMELRGRLMEVLSRIEQRAGGGSSPSNANWVRPLPPCYCIAIFPPFPKVRVISAR